MYKEVGIAPCKDCQDRFAGCHAKCKKYKKWSKAHLEEKARIDEQNHIDKASLSEGEKFSRIPLRAVRSYRRAKR